MHKVRNHRSSIAGFVAALFLVASPAVPAAAESKDMVQLQTQIQQLQDAVARLQQSNDERMGVLKDLIQQSADSVNRMSVNMDVLQKQLAAQQVAEGGKVDQVSGQVSALNDSVDELKARLNRLEKLLGNVESQQQSMSAALQNLPQQTAANAVPPIPASMGSLPAPETPAHVTPPLAAPRTAAPPAAGPVDDLYKAAYSDYMAAKYTIASAEFEDVIRSYPENTLSGNAFYYLGEIDYRAGKYAAAAHDYDKVLEQFPDNNKAPASHLHKAQALIALDQKDAGIRELRALIQRFPATPEATQARTRLSALGAPVKPRT